MLCFMSIQPPMTYFCPSMRIMCFSLLSIKFSYMISPSSCMLKSTPCFDSLITRAYLCLMGIYIGTAPHKFMHILLVHKVCVHCVPPCLTSLDMGHYLCSINHMHTALPIYIYLYLWLCTNDCIRCVWVLGSCVLFLLHVHTNMLPLFYMLLLFMYKGSCWHKYS